MNNYQDLLHDIINDGEFIEDRTGVGTISLFGKSLRWDISHQFPAVTSKKLAWNAVVGELLWFIEGSTNIDRLRELTHGSIYSEKKTIWDANYENQAKSLGYTDGELGPVYGAQWRDWLTYDAKGNVDQLQKVIDDILEQKRSGVHNRRLLVSAWNPAEIEHMALPPCHYSFQFYLHNNKLSMLWNQRSVDTFLGLPFNIASYALLLNIICKITDCIPGELIFNGGDCHIYKNHLNQVATMLEREPKELPVLEIHKNITSLSDLKFCSPKDFELKGYKHHGVLKAPMAV
jgi:thymidylate synthase